jgi:hypothetical protein
VTRILIALLASAVAAPLAAEPFVFSGTIDAGVGYATDPRLRGFSDAGSVFGSISLVPVLTRTTGRTTTTLIGVYNREEYLRRYDHSDTASIAATHVAQISERLSGNGRVAYSTTNNPLIGSGFDAGLSDPLTIGQRTRRLEGSAGLQWQPTARDTFTGSVNASSTEYSQSTATSLARDFDQLSGQLGYSRSIDARTQVGVELVASKVDSQDFPDSNSLQPSLTLRRQLDANWVFDGHLGLIMQKIDGSSRDTSIGYGASLCGDFTRTNLCLTADRSSSASGFGGLRTDTQVTFTVEYQLTERSRLNGYASYKDSNGQRLTTITDVKVLQARGGYRYDLTQRLSVGFDARYQRRSGLARITADSIAGTVNITAKIGRLK